MILYCYFIFALEYLRQYTDYFSSKTTQLGKVLQKQNVSYKLSFIFYTSAVNVKQFPKLYFV